MTEECILAPVSVAYLPDVQRILDETGNRVAFGSNDAGVETWGHSAESPIGSSVYIVASSAQQEEAEDPTRFPVSKVYYAGVLTRVVHHGESGTVDPPLIQPDSTEMTSAEHPRETSWTTYWELGELRRLETELTPSAFQTRAEGAMTEFPSKPMLALRPG